MNQQDTQPVAGAHDVPDERPPESSFIARGALDPRVLAQLRQLDADGANRLIPRLMAAYVASQRKLLSQMAGASGASDGAVLRLAVHTLKSSSASVGALRLSTLCAEAENALRAGHVDQVPALIATMAAEAARVESAVLQLLSDS